MGRLPSGKDGSSGGWRRAIRGLAIRFRVRCRDSRVCTVAGAGVVRDFRWGERLGVQGQRGCVCGAPRRMATAQKSAKKSAPSKGSGAKGSGAKGSEAKGSNGKAYVKSSRCWPGYVPVPGKGEHEEGSCRKAPTSKNGGVEVDRETARKKQISMGGRRAEQAKGKSPDAAERKAVSKAAKSVPAKKTAGKRASGKKTSAKTAA